MIEKQACNAITEALSSDGTHSRYQVQLMCSCHIHFLFQKMLKILEFIKTVLYLELAVKNEYKRAHVSSSGFEIASGPLVFSQTITCISISFVTCQSPLKCDNNKKPRTSTKQ